MRYECTYYFDADSDEEACNIVEVMNLTLHRAPPHALNRDLIITIPQLYSNNTVKRVEEEEE